MKKHIFAFICVFVLIFNTFTYTQTKAMDIGVAIDVGSEILYEGWDMIQSIFNGFVISLGQYSGYADKASAMAAFYNDWGDVLTVLTQGYLSPDQVEQSAITANTVYPLDFGMSGAVMRDFINQYGNWVYDPTLGMYADINQKSIASWNRYNDGWVKKFLDAHNADIEQHPTYPDPQFETFLDKINGTGFWFKEFQNKNNDNNAINGLVNYPPTLTSWVVNNNSSNFNSNSDYYYVVTTDILTLDINSTAGTYYFSYSVPNSLVLKNFVLPWSPYTGKPNGYISRSNQMFGIANTSDSSNTNNFSVSGSLGQVLDYISIYFRNVNIYVDGVLWSYVGQVQQPNVELGIDHPRYDENGQMIGNDVFFPEQDLKADIVKFTELIDDKILSGESIDLDDLIDAGVLTDSEGNIITDENRDTYIKKKDIATVITDALDDTVVNDLLPDAPDPPPDDPWNWHFPTIVIPEGGDSDPRGTGISVLARIINVTNQSLPGEVITMFWGICITMLILGIIKILHK